MGVKSRGVARKGGDQYAKGKARPSNAAGEGSSSQFPPKKAAQESIFNLKKYLEKKIQIKFLGGREVVGILKGYDALNFVIDETEELMPNVAGSTANPPERRSLGLVVCRSTAIGVISPFEGTEKIPNPFVDAR